MPSPLKNRALALIGLLGMVPLALGLIRGTLTVDAAGLRAAGLLILLVVVERFVLPLSALLASADPPGPGRRLDDDRGGHLPDPR